MRKSSIVYLCILSMMVVAGVVACGNPFSSSSSSSGSAAPTAADALRAIPLASEVLGVSTAQASALRASSQSQIRALSSPPSWTEYEEWDQICNEDDHPQSGDYPDELCGIYGGTMYEFFQVDMFVDILRKLADQTDVPLAMDSPIQLSGISPAIFPSRFWVDEDGNEDAPDQVNAGVIEITRLSDRARIKWLFDYQGLFGGEPGTAPDEYLWIDLIGWPAEVTEVSLWYFGADDDDDAVDPTDLAWEHQRAIVQDQRIFKISEQPKRTYNVGGKLEKFVFQGTEGGLNAFTSFDERKNDNGGPDVSAGYINSYIIRNNFTASAETRFGADDNSRLDLSEPLNSNVWVFGENLQIAKHGVGTVNSSGAVELHGKSFNFAPAAEREFNAADTSVQALLSVSAELMPIWEGAQMPEKPVISTFPEWPSSW